MFLTPVEELHYCCYFITVYTHLQCHRRSRILFHFRSTLCHFQFLREFIVLGFSSCSFIVSCFFCVVFFYPVTLCMQVVSDSFVHVKTFFFINLTYLNYPLLTLRYFLILYKCFLVTATSSLHCSLNKTHND